MADKSLSVLVSGPSDWKTPQLKEIDRLLRCPICFDFYQTPMILPCSHSFCSLCIRRYLQYKSNCPSCMQTASISAIINNLVLGEICIQFVKTRKVLLKLCQEEYSKNTTNTVHVHRSQCNTNNKDTKHIVPLPPAENFVFKSENIEEEIEQATCSVAEIQGFSVKEEEIEDLTPPLLGSPNCSKQGVLFGDLKCDLGTDTSKSMSVLCDDDDVKCGVSDLLCDTMVSNVDLSVSSTGDTRNNDQDDNNAECPVCGMQVLSKHINNHLDICLKYSRTREHTATKRSSYVLPRLPKLCYTVMKDSQLRQKLKEYHLPSNGQRSSLISRLKEFTLQYNAQCDSSQPKTIKEIASEVEIMEKAKGTPRKKHNTGLQLNRSSTLEEVEVQCKKYATRYTTHYEGLINGVRKRLLSCGEEPVDKKIKLSNDKEKDNYYNHHK